MSNSKVFKSVSFTPRHVFVVKTIDKDLEKKKIRQGDTSYMPIPIAMKDVSSKLHDVAKELSCAVNFTASSAMNFLDEDFFVSINKKIHPETGAKIPSQGSERIKSVGGFDFSEFFSPGYKQLSRVERIVRAELCSLFDSFADKFRECKHASQGKKRTFSTTQPRMGVKINFGFVDKGFYRTYLTNKKNVIEIRFVVKDIIVSIIGSIPDTYNDADTTYSPATVHFDKGGNAIFHIPVAYPRLYTSVSSQYCLSADIGKKHPYVVSVIRMSDEEVVDTVYPSLRIYKIQRDINSSDQQIQDIKEKLSLIEHRERTYEKNRTLGRTTDKDYQQHLVDLELTALAISHLLAQA